ncbi:hypothetical protein U9M48_017413 [Paspalum notatum var. saurae]|uniref:Uncharacterized protein n=1 Tax=Paspalum notatum var. saurae TaxID=547442 RepID=A0AAQ3T9E9_PASNO
MAVRPGVSRAEDFDEFGVAFHVLALLPLLAYYSPSPLSVPVNGLILCTVLWYGVEPDHSLEAMQLTVA